MEQIGRALYVGGGLFWNAFWALAFGYAFSSLIQVLVRRDVIARYLGRAGAKETALGVFLGRHRLRVRSQRSRQGVPCWRKAVRQVARHT